MKIFLHEINEQEINLEFDEQTEWLNEAVYRVDERAEGSLKLPKKRKVQTELSLRQVDGVVVISGTIDTFVELTCSRCAATFEFRCHPHFSALYCQDPVMAGIAHIPHKHGKENRIKQRPMGQNQGFARHAHNSEDDESVSEGKDLDISYLAEDYIQLGDVIQEQLQFQVPFQPLCKENCKGICAQCGTDLNVGRCACAKLATKSPFSVLSHIKF